MKQFRTYLRTRSKNADYKWIGNTPQMSIDKLEALEGNRLYALCIEKERSRHYVFIHVFMPGTGDNIGGFIRLEIAVGALTETQARALALAYLKLPIQGNNRVWEAAQKTYTQTDDDGCTVDITALQKEIERLIEENEPLLFSESPGHQLRLWESIRTKGSQTQKAIEHLQRYRLSEADGIKVYLNDSTTKKEADLSLRAEDASEDKEEQLPLPKKDTPPEGTDRLRAVCEYAEDLYRKAKVTVDKAPEPTKKWCAGCLLVSIVVLLILVIGLIPSPRSILVESTLKTLHLKIQGKEYTIGASREIKLKPTPSGIVELQITDIPPGSPVKLNGTEIGTGPGTYTIPADGGSLQILLPKS